MDDSDFFATLAEGLLNVPPESSTQEPTRPSEPIRAGDVCTILGSGLGQVYVLQTAVKYYRGIRNSVQRIRTPFLE